VHTKCGVCCGPVAAKTGLLFTLRLIPVISTMLARRGIDAAPMLVKAGVPLDAMRGEITAPLARVQAFMARAADALGTDLFGIELSEAMPSGSYGVAEFLTRSAPTIGASLRLLCEFSSLINPIANMKLAPTETETAFHYAVGSERDMLGVHLNEFSISYIVRQFKAVQGTQMPLSRLWFAHARPTGADAVAQRFGCSVRFQAPDCGFAVAREVVDAPTRTADPVLFEFLLQQARAQLARAGELDIVTHLVRVLETRLTSSALGADDVARAMAMTPRTLQRQLATAGTSFREVLAHVRIRRRAELLGGGQSEAAVAKHLGFSDVRAMRRSLDD
jgi:AraC-like DNA-binding protein